MVTDLVTTSCGSKRAHGALGDSLISQSHLVHIPTYSVDLSALG